MVVAKSPTASFVSKHIITLCYIFLYYKFFSRLDYHPEKGIYDLLISNASYDRDNGRFECKVKESGTGANLHVQKYTLTVLTMPQQPVIAPGAMVTTTEGKKQELVCSSVGGSPDPHVKWYREGECSL